MRIFTLTCGAAVAVAQTLSPALADDDNLCGALLSDDFVTGNYTMTIGPGAYFVGAITKSYPKTHVLSATIYSAGDELILISDHGFNMTFKDVEFDERDWKFNKGEFGMSLSSSDFALSVGCANINEMPRLHATGTGSYFANDGSEVPTAMKLFVHKVDDDKGVNALGGITANAPNGVVFKLRMKLEAN